MARDAVARFRGLRVDAVPRERDDAPLRADVLRADVVRVAGRDVDRPRGLLGDVLERVGDRREREEVTR